MKKNNLVFILFNLVFYFCLVSCQLYPADKGVFCIENRSLNSKIYISNVMIKTESNNNYKSIFNGTIPSKVAEYFLVEEGKYFVQVTYRTTDVYGFGFLESEKTAETGWAKIDKNHSPVLIFDGEKLFIQ